ncbi:hypothetical protein ABW21_db0200431 [Orbilia brochopaga]|nr:hypothetical protein ABW21_db0200431 [Drechslerella brochopaga]
MDPRSPPTPSASPTSEVAPCRTFQLLLDLLLSLTSDSSVPPTYPEPLNDRSRGILYPAVCHRIKYHAGPLNPSDSQRVLEIVQVATNLVGYLYPFHSFDLQVELCSKIVLFGLLLPSNNDIVGVPELKKILLDSSSTQTTEVGELFAELERRKQKADPTLGVFGLWPVFLIIPAVQRTACQFGPISNATAKVAIADGVIRSFIESETVQDQNASHDQALDDKSVARFLKESGITRLLVGLIFPQNEFEEAEYGSVYFPVLGKLSDFTEAITTIATNLCDNPHQETTLAYNTLLLLQSATAASKATSSYKAVHDAFRQQPQLWKFAEAYMKGHVCAIIGTNNGIEKLFDGDWRDSLRAEWKRRNHSEIPHDVTRGAKREKHGSQESVVEKAESGSPKSWIRRTVEEYDGWEFLR